MMRNIVVACLSLVFSLVAIGEELTDDAAQGKKLFEKYGCINCHGQDGIHPTSKYVPVLQGKSAAYFFENATAIFANDRADRKIHAMHDQFCIGEEPEEGCYPAPSSQDLMMIANWLGSTSLPEKKRTPQELYVTSTERLHGYRRLRGRQDQARTEKGRTCGERLEEQRSAMEL